MRYSVLMSVYKNDNPIFLKTALESVYELQTRKPDEIVVVFDGPLTDELYSVLNAFAADKCNIIHYLQQEKNLGLGEALRIGAMHCTGDYIFRMDSDDISEASRFEKQIAYVEAHPEVDVLGTDIAEFEETVHEKMRLRICPEYHEDIVRMGKRRNPMNHVSVCMKRSALEKCGGYQSLILLEDYYLWLRMIVNDCLFANIHEPLVYVRIGKSFNAKRGARARADGWPVLQRYMLSNGMITRWEAITNMIYIWIFVLTPPGIKKFLYERVLRK